MNIYILIAVTLTLSHASTVPPNFKRCRRQNPNFQNCLFEAAQHGITQLTKPYPELDLQDLEPLELSSLTVPGRDGPVAVTQNFNTCNLHGLTTMRFQKFQLDLKSQILEASGTVRNLTLMCYYQLDGKVLQLPIQGHGNSTIAFTDFQANFFVLFDEVEKKGKTFYKMAYNELTTDAGMVYFRFDNLFNGDKALSDSINKFLNDNWKEIYDGVKSDYNEVIRQTLANIMDRLWSKVSLEDLFD